MGTAFLHGNGGSGGGSLNFKIKAYASVDDLPESAKENTIAVITETPITEWVFSATEPKNPIEGMIWIVTGESSSVEFNALKKNGIHVYPLITVQRIDDEWIGKVAKSYQGGMWADWVTYIFNNGTIVEQTGAWTISGVTSNVEYHIGDVLKLNCNYPGDSHYTATLKHSTAISRGNRKMLNIHFVSIKAANGNTENPAFVVSGSNGAFEMKYNNLDKTDWILEIDVSNVNKEFIISFWSHPWQSLKSYCQMTVDRIWFS